MAESSNSRFVLLGRRNPVLRATKGLRWGEIVLTLLTTFPQVIAATATAAITAPTNAYAPTDAAKSTAATTADAVGTTAAIANPAADQTLLLDVQINGNPIGKIGEFTLRGGVLLARRSELHQLGLQGLAPVASRNIVTRPPVSDSLIFLSDLPGLTLHLDRKTQTLYIAASSDRLLPTLLEVDNDEIHTDRRVIESGTGMTLNYDFASTYAGGQTGASGSLDLRAFSPWGILSSGLLTYAGANQGGPGTKTAIRLDSAYTYADVNTLRRYSLGDFITGGLAWTRPIRLGGAQIRSDFSMRPDLVTFPMPSVSGSVAVPSTLDVLADGNLVISRQINAGPFEIPQLPVVSGAGTISMTVTNALGQQVNMTRPFYASSALLAPGLQTFSGQVGLVRRNWGAISNDYGKFAATATYRRGLTSRVTVEGSAEATPGTVMAGGGVVVNIGNYGTINAAGAASAGSAGGGQVSIGGQRIGRVINVGASTTIATRNYRDVAAVNGDPVPRRQLGASAGVSLRRFGSAGIAYAGLDRDAATNPVKLYIVPTQHSHVFSANYSFQVHHLSFYATEFIDLVSKGSGGLQVGVTIPYGRRTSVDVSGSSGGDAQVQAQKSAATVGDWGYQAYVAGGDTPHEFAQVQYKSPRGLLTAGVDSIDGQTSTRFESQGAFSLVNGALFASNTIYDSFGVVNTGSLTHVRVLQENRDVGRTDSSGRLLVPDMRSFDLNHIAIEPTDIPADATIDSTTHDLRPQDRSGVVIRFPVQFSHGALLRLVDEAGSPLPVGSTATLRATGLPMQVGYDGEAYIQNLSPHNALSVERPDGKLCSVAFDYRPVHGEIPTIGPLRCRETAP